MPDHSCPICSKACQEAFRPFCSLRCSRVDLARWLNGSYAIPTPETPTESNGSDQDAPGFGRDYDTDRLH